MRKQSAVDLNNKAKFAKLLQNLTVEEARELYISKNSQILTDEDIELVMEAFDFARKRCVEGRHHTVSVGRSESGEIYYGLQLNASRAREYSECAESGILHNSQLAYDPMVTLVTVRFKPDKTGNKQAQPDIAPPCGGCIERWRRYNPECMVILDKDGLFKFPVKDIFLFAYPTSN